MRRITLTIFIVISLGTVYGDQCTEGDGSGVVDKVLQECPRFYDDKSKTKCCIDQQSNLFYCCTEEEYSAQQSISLWIPITVSILGMILLFGTSIWCCRRLHMRYSRCHQDRLPVNQ